MTDIQEKIEQSSSCLEARARSYGAIYGSAKGPRNVRLRLQLIDQLAPLRGNRLLDIGCGNGAYTQVMACNFNDVYGIDVEAERLKIFSEKNTCDNIKILNMSADKMIFESGTFDMVTAIEVVEHVLDLAAVLKEVYRVLRPGGLFALTTPNRLWPLEQHGFTLNGKWLPGWAAPGLVWFPPLHRVLSDADAFTVARLEFLLRNAQFMPVGHRYLFPPLDRFSDGHLFHKMFDALSHTPFRIFAQTIVLVSKKA